MKKLIELIEKEEYRDRESLVDSEKCSVCGVGLFLHENNLCDYCAEMLLIEGEEEENY